MFTHTQRHSAPKQCFSGWATGPSIRQQHSSCIELPCLNVAMTEVSLCQSLVLRLENRCAGWCSAPWQRGDGKHPGRPSPLSKGRTWSPTSSFYRRGLYFNMCFAGDKTVFKPQTPCLLILFKLSSENILLCFCITQN